MEYTINSKISNDQKVPRSRLPLSSQIRNLWDPSWLSVCAFFGPHGLIHATLLQRRTLHPENFCRTFSLFLARTGPPVPVHKAQHEGRKNAVACHANKMLQLLCQAIRTNGKIVKGRKIKTRKVMNVKQCHAYQDTSRSR